MKFVASDWAGVKGCWLERRIANDKKRGVRTSERAILFVLHHCPCDTCKDKRHEVLETKHEQKRLEKEAQERSKSQASGQALSALYAPILDAYTRDIYTRERAQKK